MASVNVKITESKVMVDKSNVVVADVKASNGVIHVIDKVLVPETKTAKKSNSGCSN